MASKKKPVVAGDGKPSGVGVIRDGDPLAGPIMVSVDDFNRLKTVNGWLLAALVAAEEDLSEVPGRNDPPSLAIVRAAIAKAEGRNG